MTTHIVEGVPYYRFHVTLKYVNPKRPLLRWTRWSPGKPWVFEEVTRELAARGVEPEELKSVTIERAPG
jgi:hypothetical protein